MEDTFIARAWKYQPTLKEVFDLFCIFYLYRVIVLFHNCWFPLPVGMFILLT
jgi:hypothetical protein